MKLYQIRRIIEMYDADEITKEEAQEMIREEVNNG
ncbi:hypothetical protein PSYJYH_000040 [Bacillus phage PSYJ-YH]|nr:hypothetical protein PSYJYH_000040 [Bacillus phage PSYJ-YH]